MSRLSPLLAKVREGIQGASSSSSLSAPVALIALATKVRRSAVALGYARWFLRGCRVGARARCFGRPHVGAAGSVSIGDDFALACDFGTVHLGAAREGSIAIGDGVTINYGTSISARRAVTIGDRVKIGPYCVISDSDVPLPLPDDRAPSAAAAIEIGEDVWVAGRVTILPGSRIGKGAVIAAGSVVAGEIPAYAIVSGSPARVLRVQAPAQHAAA